MLETANGALRIGAGAGFADDQIEPAVALAAAGGGWLASSHYVGASEQVKWTLARERLVAARIGIRGAAS